MKMRNTIIYVLVLFLMILSSCSYFISKKEICGTYAPLDYKNTYDTIVIKENNIYTRRIYDANNNLKMEMQGSWKIVDGNKVQFWSFFFNLDRDIDKYPELLEDTTGGMQVLFYKKKGKTEFHFGYYNDIIYRKVE